MGTKEALPHIICIKDLAGFRSPVTEKNLKTEVDCRTFPAYGLIWEAVVIINDQRQNLSFTCSNIIVDGGRDFGLPCEAQPIGRTSQYQRRQ